MSQPAMNPDTQAILLLCGRFGGERQDAFQPLSTREYGELAKWLFSRSIWPSDLMDQAQGALIFEVGEAKLDPKRLEFLIGRGTALALSLERWQRAGLWVISRSDAEYPARLKKRLKNATTPLLYGAGDKTLLNLGGLAMVGSRDASESALEFTRQVAVQCAREEMAVVSGGARGIDLAAMQGATDAGGKAVGVLANDLLKTSLNRPNRIALQEGNLVLLSPFYPEEGSNADNAKARNKYIYAMSDHALVVESAKGTGRTWAAALENLRQRWVPMFVRPQSDSVGNMALIEQGAVAFSFEPHSEQRLADFFTNSETSNSELSTLAAQLQPSLIEVVPTSIAQPIPETRPPSESASAEPHELLAAADSVVPLNVGQKSEFAATHSLDMLSDFIGKLSLLLANGPLGDDEIAAALLIEKSQAKAWLKRATDEQWLEKLKKPVRYALRKQATLC
jgi:predicted Rossmann fold nucleotide-binding protein DprA/Smf involved in DNA uptake